MKELSKKLLNDPKYFGATVLRIGLALLLLFAGINKFRMGYADFVDLMVAGEMLPRLAGDAPDILIQIFAYVLPVAELIVGLLLLFNLYTKEAYIGLAVIFLIFTFGQMYEGSPENLNIVMTEYFTTLLATVVAFHLHEDKK